MTTRRSFIKLLAATPIVGLTGLETEGKVQDSLIANEWEKIEIANPSFPAPVFNKKSPLGTIARNFNIGLELHETGLNIFSKRLYQQKPNLFEKREEIIIDPRTLRSLILYLRVDEALSFNLTPVSGPYQNEVGLNELFILAKITFTLTDRIPGGGGIGLITRISAHLEGIAEIGFSGNAIALSLNSFRVTNLTANHPFPPVLRNGSIDLTPSLNASNKTAREKGTPENELLTSCDASFQAILNYLIEVFLKDALKRPLAEFKVPELDKLPNIPVPLYLRGVSIFSNRLGVYLKHTSGGLESPSGPEPAPQNPQPHLSVGVVKETIQRVINAQLPVRTPLTPTDEWFRVRGGFIKITRGEVLQLQQPNKVVGQFYLEANFDLAIVFRLAGYNIRIEFNVPFGEPSHVRGGFYLLKREVNNKDGTKSFKLFMRPSNDFFNLNEDRVILVTNFRDQFRDEVRRWLRKHVSPKLKKIPIIGWIISKGVEVIVGEIMAYLVGAYLDSFVSVWLTLLSNAVIQVLKLIGKTELIELELLELQQKLPLSEINLDIKALGDPRIEPNANGEVVLDCWFEDRDLPITPIPIGTSPSLPQPPTGPDDPPPIEPIPFPDSAFLPKLALTSVTWKNGNRLRYEIVTTSNENGAVERLEQIVNFDLLTEPERWQVEVSTAIENQPITSTTICSFDPINLQPLSEQGITSVTEPLPTGSNNYKVRLSEVFDYNAQKVDVRIETGIELPDLPTRTISSPRRQVSIPANSLVATNATWIFRLMSMELSVGLTGKIARLDADLETDGSNRAKFIPADMKVESLDEVSFNGSQIQTFKVMVTENEMTATAWIEDSSERRLIQYEQKEKEFTMRMKLLP